MRTSTRVYPLEEGDVSMIARAWLTEAAERSIDVQYFIFSADNVGLIAVDYMLRAADRGVHVRLIVDDFMLEADAEKLLALDAHPNIEIRPVQSDDEHRQESSDQTMVVDDETAVIATLNLDPRSANLNTECLTIIRDARVAESVRRTIDIDMQPENSWHTTRDFNPNGAVGIGKRIKVWLRRVEPKAVL